MADQITALNSHIDAQEQVIKKLEERERSLQSTLVLTSGNIYCFVSSGKFMMDIFFQISIDKELVLRQQAMDLHKRKVLVYAYAVEYFNRLFMQPDFDNFL